MQIELAKENEDGSAVYTFDMTEEEKKLLILFGIRRALEDAAKAAKEWDGTPDLEENAGLSD